MRQNLVFPMAYNVLVLGLSTTGTVPPVAAAFAMLGSSLSVILSTTRLARFAGKQAAAGDAADTPVRTPTPVEAAITVAGLLARRIAPMDLPLSDESAGN
ncbi:hypothetical protein G4G28_09765 [Massilia sp. Dwa41.01b]|uniref:hypothetical protein n=1 Tax=unclassified Massilia TaxID=2609279 RepID=UPI0015FF0AFE|nr:MULTISPECIES: hypothetical protein [unclassified Massilia]QNA87217.1 hypothetical protein G4G28_09765 [Massilia sp. Dwa41.01b]QNA97558.1 hypothetical protein G4G31_13440 [Massilia sp. Se16.2.3]